MSKVLFLVNHDVVIYNFRCELVEELIKLKHEVVISCPYGERIDDLVAFGAKHVDLEIDRHGMNPIKDLKLIKYYKSLMKEEKPDIIFSYTIKPNIYGAIAARKCKIPFIANITGLGQGIESGGLKQKLCVFLYKRAFIKVRKVYFQNLDNRQFFIDHKIAVDKHDMLPGSGVNLNKYTVQKFQSYNTFLFMARIMKEKGINEFLDAATRLKEKHPEVNIYVCGFCDDDYSDVIKEYSDRGIIEYGGMVRDTVSYYAKTSCIILPSYHEGMSNTLLEAAACGRPIIASNIPGCRESVIDNESGLLCEPRNADDLYNKMEKFLSLSDKEKVNMGLRGRKLMEEKFDRYIVVNKYIDELKSL